MHERVVQSVVPTFGNIAIEYRNINRHHAHKLGLRGCAAKLRASLRRIRRLDLRVVRAELGGRHAIGVVGQRVSAGVSASIPSAARVRAASRAVRACAPLSLLLLLHSVTLGAVRGLRT